MRQRFDRVVAGALLVIAGLPGCGDSRRGAKVAPPPETSPQASGPRVEHREPSPFEGKVGRTIAVTGEVVNTKIPNVNGLFVDHVLEGFRGRVVTVRGTVRKQVITEEGARANAASDHSVAMMGAGTTYRLDQAELLHVPK